MESRVGLSRAGIHRTFSVGPDIASHPGLASTLSQKLVKAQELGFKVIRMTDLVQSGAQKSMVRLLSIILAA
jgi:hypothetical protein